MPRSAGHGDPDRPGLAGQWGGCDAGPAAPEEAKPRTLRSTFGHDGSASEPTLSSVLRFGLGRLRGRLRCREADRLTTANTSIIGDVTDLVL